VNWHPLNRFGRVHWKHNLGSIIRPRRRRTGSQSGRPSGPLAMRFSEAYNVRSSLLVGCGPVCIVYARGLNPAFGRSSEPRTWIPIKTMP
jgi:hypothetical protein